MCLFLMMGLVLSRDDGIARTPPMGWSTWYAFKGDINETKILDIAEKLLSVGLLSAGYEYVNLDDAWMSPLRDRYGRLQGDPSRFPHGIKWLADRIHSMGLKLGLYGCPSIQTCLGYPGQFQHEYQDAQTIADWGVDFWKHDNCFMKWSPVDTYTPYLFNSSLPKEKDICAQELSLNIRGLSVEGEDAHPIRWQNLSGDPLPVSPRDMPRGHQSQYHEAYRLFGEALAATGRPILYSICPLIAGCDASVWNYYRPYAHMSMNQCIQRDNEDSWDSFLYHIQDNNAFPERATAAGPGYWNDLDFLQLGYKTKMPAQSFEEYRSQISIFAVLAAPLFLGWTCRRGWGVQKGGALHIPPHIHTPPCLPP